MAPDGAALRALWLQTTEIRMTENVRDSGLRFEIWFRRRHKSQDTYVLQASSAEVKAAWTAAIRKILWWQALQNRGGQEGRGASSVLRGLAQGQGV